MFRFFVRPLFGCKITGKLFSNKSGNSLEYLTILIREIKGLKQNPNKIKDFPNISENVVIKLENIGIKKTFQLSDKVLTSESRKELRNGY